LAVNRFTPRDSLTLSVAVIVGVYRPDSSAGEAEPGPPVFNIGDLTILPRSVQAGEGVVISLSITNIAGTEGTYTVVVMVNDVKEAEESVTIAAGSTRHITFSLLKEVPGDYNVIVGGLSRNFTVVARTELSPPPPAPETPVSRLEPSALEAPPPAPQSTTNWVVIGVVAAVAAMLIILLIIGWIMKRKYKLKVSEKV